MIIVFLLIVIFLVILFYTIRKNEQLGEEEEERKQAEIAKHKRKIEREQKEFEEFKKSFDLVIGNKDKFVAFKGDTITLSNGKTYSNISKLRYVLDNKLHAHTYNFMLITEDNKLHNQYLARWSNEQLNTLKQTMDRLGAKQIATWLKFAPHKEFKSFLNENSYIGGYIIYKLNPQDDYLYFSDAKDNSKWYLTDIDYQPKYFVDYDVQTTVNTSGNIGGRTGSAVVGGIIAGPTGAIVGSSRGKKLNTTSTTHENKVAHEREEAAPALLSLRNENGARIKVELMLFNVQVLALKKNFLSNQKETERPSLSTQLRELKQLVEDGILTEEEFAKKKSQLLGI